MKKLLALFCSLFFVTPIIAQSASNNAGSGTCESKADDANKAADAAASALMKLALGSSSNASAAADAQKAATTAAKATIAAAPSCTPKNNLDTTNFDLGVPDSPAFTFLNVTPQTISRPTTPRDFATTLLNGVDENGNFQNGIAMDFSPYLIWANSRVTLQSYRDNPIRRVAARTTVSFGTTKGTSDTDKSTKLAVGIRAVLWDQADPRTSKALDTCFEIEVNSIDYQTALRKALAKGPPNLEEGTKSAKFPEATTQATKLVGAYMTKCRQFVAEENWSASSWIVGAATGWTSATGVTNDMTQAGVGAWTTIAFRLGRDPMKDPEKIKKITAINFDDPDELKHNRQAQILFHGRFRNKEVAPDPNSTAKNATREQNSRTAGGQFRYGTFSTNFLTEGLYQHIIPAGAPPKPENTFRYSLGLEHRLSDKLWITATFGGDRGPNGNHLLVLSNFKWNFGQQAQLNPVKTTPSKTGSASAATPKAGTSNQ
jgi:hypothetical protein